MAELDVIVPVFNEAAGLITFHRELSCEMEKLPYSWRVLYVNDGSSDGTQDVLDEFCAADARVTSIELSRNFGHQAALTAGLDRAEAAIIIMLDGDGQHPPGLIHDMLALHSCGYQIVQTTRNDIAGSASILKRVTARLFYRLINWLGDVHIEEGSADFRLITRDVLIAIRSVTEYHRFLRGIFAWVGFRSVILPYQPRPRKHGETKYSVKKMLRLAADGIFSFSLTPLRLGLSFGALLGAVALFELAYIASFYISGRQTLLVPGWSSLITLLTVCNSILMCLLGIIGIYVGMIFQEVKRRPVYIVRHLDSELSHTNERPIVSVAGFNPADFPAVSFQSLAASHNQAQGRMQE
jgi:glycosyltransferase involved in cell wall biosynthesis